MRILSRSVLDNLQTKSGSAGKCDGGKQPSHRRQGNLRSEIANAVLLWVKRKKWGWGGEFKAATIEASGYGLGESYHYCR